MSPVHDTGRHGGDRDRPGEPEERSASSVTRIDPSRYAHGKSAQRLVAETLADSEAWLLARIAYLETRIACLEAAADDVLLVAALGDAEAYRTVAREALNRLHEYDVREMSLRRQLAALRDELRRYTARQVAA